MFTPLLLLDADEEGLWLLLPGDVVLRLAVGWDGDDGDDGDDDDDDDDELLKDEVLGLL